jgi:putative nucleotidyltransferase with HDIG domain
MNEISQRIEELLPELSWINDSELRSNVIAAYEDALATGGWTPNDMGTIPFTLLIPDCPFSYLDHVRGVTRMAKLAMDEFNSIYAAKDPKFTMDNDILVAGALLHDVGKLVEYERDAQGRTVKSNLGRNLRHPFSGAHLAVKHGCPYEVAHIIANHAHEGDGTLRSPEAVLVNKADFMNFESVKSFLGMK